MNDEFISFGEVARLMRLSRPTVRKRLGDGTIPGLVEHYGIQRVDRKTFEKWLGTKDR